MADFFTLSKLARLVIEPTFLFSILFIVSTLLLFTAWWRLGRAGMVCLLLFGGLVSIVPLGTWGKTLLEYRFPVTDLPATLDGVVVLGGALSPAPDEEFIGVSINHNFERILTFIKLGQRYPQAKLIFTGGVGSLRRDQESEALLARRIFDGLGLDSSRVQFEPEARNTHENAVYAKRLAGDVSKQTWVLVTSARHVPRAVGVFRKQGWDVLPFPVDFRTNGQYEWTWSFDIVLRVVSLRIAMTEWIGLLAYRIKGYTDDVFPSPD